MDELGAEALRCAEVIAHHDGRPSSRGSGYLISGTTVITARHVVEGAQSVRVRFGADTPTERTMEVRRIIAPGSNGSADIAALEIEESEDLVVRAAFGKLGRRQGVAESHAVGFPAFKMKSYETHSTGEKPGLYRDSYDARGSIAMLSNMREDTYEFQTTKSSGLVRGTEDPWSGMSGAAVWVNGSIVGIVKSHSDSDGVGVLGVEPLTRLYDQSADIVREALGLAEEPADLVDVSERMSRASAISDAYAAEARAMAPEELQDRDEDIKEVVRFLASQSSYGWWQGGAYAGKTAFAATIAFKPPVGTDVAFFFVIRRLTAQSTQSAYLVSMTQQLYAIAGSESVSISGYGGQRGLYEMAIEAAARASRSRGNKLVLIVDGLDEDQGIHSGSIASVLPAHPPEGVKVLLTSRPHPGIPSDVPMGHPLRECVPRPIAPWRDSEQDRILAINELEENYAGDELRQRVIGFLTAAGGGLSADDLSSLLRVSALTLKRTLASSFARSFRTRLPAHSPQEGYFYLFGHDTLREVAEELLAQELAPFRQVIKEWADGYRAKGWPEDTPEYLLTAYGTALSKTGYSAELFELMTDKRRQNQTITRTGSNAICVEELVLLRHILAESDHETPFLHAVISASMSRVTTPSLEPPHELPVALSRLGDYGSAEGWARQFKVPYVRATALCRVAIAAAGGFTEWALQLANDALELAPAVTVISARERLLAAAAGALAAANRTKQALSVAETISNETTRYACLGTICAQAWQSDQNLALQILTDAERTAPSATRMTVAAVRAGLLRGWVLADRLKATSEVDAVLKLSSGVVGRAASDFCLREVIRALVSLGDVTRASELVGQLSVPLERALWRAKLINVQTAPTGDGSNIARVQSIADGLPISGRLSVLSQAYASSLESGADGLTPLETYVERAISALPTAPTRAQAFADAASRMATVDSTAARRMVSACTRELRSSGELGLKDQTLEGLMHATMNLGHFSGTIRSILSLSTSALRREAIRIFSYSGAQRGLWSELLTLSRSVSDPLIKEGIYTALATAAANHEALPILETIVESDDFTPRWEEIAEILLPSIVVAERWSIAMKLSARLPNPTDRDRAYSYISTCAAAMDDKAWEPALGAIENNTTRALVGIQIAVSAQVRAETAIVASRDVEEMLNRFSHRGEQDQGLDFSAGRGSSIRTKDNSERGLVVEQLVAVLTRASPSQERIALVSSHAPKLRSSLTGIRDSDRQSEEPSLIIKPSRQGIQQAWQRIQQQYTYPDPGNRLTEQSEICERLSSVAWYEEVDALASLGEINLDTILDAITRG